MPTKRYRSTYKEKLDWYRSTYPYIEFPETGPDSKNEKFLVSDVVYGEYLVTRKALESGKSFRHRERGYQVVSEKAREQAREKAEKIKKTNLERYGVENVFQSESVKERIRETNKSKFGTESAMQNAEVKQKAKDSYTKNWEENEKAKKEGLRRWSLERYGTDHPMQSSEHKDKIRRKIEKETGFPNRFCDPEFRRKHNSFLSRGEKELNEFVRSLGLTARKEWIRNESGQFLQEIDIFIPEKMIGVEFNGCYWHSERFGGRRRHLEKTEYAAAKGIRVIHIFECDWNERREQVKSFLRSALGQNSRRIGARKCTVQREDPDKARAFLDKYHIQGSRGRADQYYSVRLGEEILCVASFGRGHRQNQRERWFLTRFAGKDDVSVPGGLSRVVEMFSRECKEDIFTFTAKHLSDGSGFSASGWEVVGVTPPDYFYFDVNRNKKVSKQSRKKSSVKTPEGVTEREHAAHDGLVRIWDCGKIKMIFRNKRV